MPKYLDINGLSHFWDNIENSIGSASQEQVNNWLDAHPDATTTVEDGSITNAKIANNTIQDIKLVKTGGIIEILSDTRILKAGTDYTTDNGKWAGKNGAINSNAGYNAAILELKYELETVTVTTAATSAAPIAVYYSDTPSQANCIGWQDAEYLPDYATKQFTNFDLTIPSGTKYIVINRSLMNGSQPFEIKAYDESQKLKGIEEKCKDFDDIIEYLTENRKLVSDIDFEKISGKYAGNNGAINNSNGYEYALLEAQEGIYTVSTYANSAAPIAVYYSDIPSQANYIGIQNADYLPSYGLTQFEDVELTVPENTKYIIVNCNTGGYMEIELENEYQKLDGIVATTDQLNYYKNKKILFMGDSITALGKQPRGWCGKFDDIVESSLYVNVAVSGARWCDYSDTVLDGNPVFDGADNNHNNTISNQVEKIARGKDTDNPNYSYVDDYQNFDAIIIAAGTNDVNQEIGLDTQFTVNSSVVPLENLDRQTWSGAMRYAFQVLNSLYPNAYIFYCTPIQAAEQTRTYDSILTKRNNMIYICNRISDVTVIDTFNCGICNIFEIHNSNGKYLIDGLHPNEDGALKIAKYNANEFIKSFNVKQ